MKFSRRLLGGASLLARTAADLADDHDDSASASAAQTNDDPPQGDPGDEDDGGDAHEPETGEEDGAGDDADAGEGDDLVVTESDPDAVAARESAEARGRSQMADRIKAVFASEHVIGREAAAAELLADDLPADRVISLLQKMPKGDASSMLDGIRGTAKNPDLKAGSESEPDQSQVKSMWDRIVDNQAKK